MCGTSFRCLWYRVCSCGSQGSQASVGTRSEHESSTIPTSMCSESVMPFCHLTNIVASCHYVQEGHHCPMIRRQTVTIPELWPQRLSVSGSGSLERVLQLLEVGTCFTLMYSKCSIAQQLSVQRCQAFVVCPLFYTMQIACFRLPGNPCEA